MTEKTVSETLAQNEFFPGTIPAVNIVDPKTKLPCRKRRFSFWVPKSNRARLMFFTVTFDHPDKKIIRAAHKIFYVKEMAISSFSYQDKVHIVSTRKDPHRLIETLDRFEESLTFHLQHEKFKGIMGNEPTVQDYWVMLKAMLNESDREVRRRFFGTLVLAHDQVLQTVRH